MSIIAAPPTPGSPDGGRAAGLSDMRDRISGLRDGFSARQRRTMAIVGVGVVVAVLGWSTLKPEPDWSPLYTNLDAEDAGVITKKLQETGVEYQLTDGGATVEVDKDAIYQTRADLAELDLPGSGKVGYGILDDQGLTTSEFGQRVGFQRAMEGEIAATIEAMDGVTAATVHLALPPDQVFALDDQKPSASVMVKTTDSLDTEQVQAVVNLVASSIQGMEAGSVSVSDAQGRVLAAPGTGVTAGGGGGDAREQSASYEASLSSAIEGMLTAAVGPGNAKATVTANMDFSATTATKETFEAPADPTGVAEPIPLDEEVKTETYGGGDAATQGVLGPTGAPTGTTGAGSYSLNERNVRNAVNKVTETTQQAPGTVERLSVAVMVDEDAVGPEQVADLQALVGAAAGIDPARGDTIVVSRIGFDQSVQESMTKELEAREVEAKDDSMLMIAIAGGAVLLAAVIGFLLMRGRRKDRRELDALALEAAEMYEALGPGSASSSTSGAVDLTYTDRPVSAISGDPTERRRDERRQVVSELIDNQPDEVAELLRGWLGDRRSVRR